MLSLPLFLILRIRPGVKIVAARVASSEGFVPVKNHAHLVGNGVVRGAHNGKDVPVTGPRCQGAETAGGKADPHGVRGLPFLDDGVPVVFRLDAVDPLHLLDVVVLVLFAEKRRGSVALGHYRHGHTRIAHPAVKIVGHSTV